jgi:hypothetical protein
MRRSKLVECGMRLEMRGLAEREGFEPPIPLRVRRISSAVLSTTQPPLHTGCEFLERWSLIPLSRAPIGAKRPSCHPHHVGQGAPSTRTAAERGDSRNAQVVQALARGEEINPKPRAARAPPACKSLPAVVGAAVGIAVFTKRPQQMYADDDHLSTKLPATGKHQTHIKSWRAR